jgi:hypothetical protein
MKKQNKLLSVQFRPHHFMCTLGFQGKGFSPEFVANFQTIADSLQYDESILIEVVENTDSICSPCPHRQNLSCEFQQKIETLDAAHKATLKIEYGDVLSWQKAKEKIQQHMTLSQFHQVCEPCQWKKLGVCEEALLNLKDSIIKHCI